MKGLRINCPVDGEVSKYLESLPDVYGKVSYRTYQLLVNIPLYVEISGLIQKFRPSEFSFVTNGDICDLFIWKE